MADPHITNGALGARERVLGTCDLAPGCAAVSAGSLVVEPSFLARVHDATWGRPDAEMRKLGRRARGNHSSFHVAQRHGLDLVFRGSGE